MSIQEARRADFEKWVNSRRMNAYLIDLFWRDGYVSWETEVAFETWNAALDSVCLDLTPANVQHASYNQVDCYSISDIKILAAAAGVNVKVAK